MKGGQSAPGASTGSGTTGS